MDEIKKSEPNMIPQNILRNLQPYKVHEEQICLFCGYKGLMGISKVELPKFANFFVVFILLFIIGFGIMLFLPFLYSLLIIFIGAILLGVIIKNKSKKHFICPNCEKEIIK